MKKLLIIPCFLFFLFSCKKDAGYSSNAFANASTAYNETSGTYTLTLQPGPSDGDDLWMKNWIRHPYYADTCDTQVGLIKGLVYPLNGSLVYTRSIIKFDSLFKKLPKGATIQTATLYLYGPTPRSKDVSVHLPMGNTSYPGSTKGDNTCYLQRISTAWSATTISWNNQPSTVADNQVVVGPSTAQWKWDVGVDVTAMVKSMSIDEIGNKGFLLRLATEVQPRALGFLSADSPESTRRPKLVVTYSL